MRGLLQSGAQSQGCMFHRTRRHAMNHDHIRGQWKQWKGLFKKEWGRLTDDDLDVAEGHRDYLIGKIQERYGIARDEAERQVERFEVRM
jgi:uncharacterized protein YjbJ (UPF0337 family)